MNLKNFDEIKESILASTSAEKITGLLSGIDISKLDNNTLNHIKNVLGDNFDNIKEGASKILDKTGVNLDDIKEKVDVNDLLGKAKGLFNKDKE